MCTVNEIKHLSIHVNKLYKLKNIFNIYVYQFKKGERCREIDTWSHSPLMFILGPPKKKQKHCKFLPILRPSLQLGYACHE